MKEQPTRQELINQIENVILDTLIGYEEKFMVELDVIEVRWDLKGGCAGMFCVRPGQMYFRFNLDIAQENVKETLEETVPHEIAHYLVYIRYGKVKPHGREWQRVMYQLGKEPTVTHKMNYTPAKVRKPQKRYSYTC